MSSRLTQTNSFGAAGNLSRRDQAKIERDPSAGDYQATTISFTAPGTIADSANGFGVFNLSDDIEVRGSPLNSRLYVITAASAGSLTVVPAMIQTESAGAPIIIARDS